MADWWLFGGPGRRSGALTSPSPLPETTQQDEGLPRKKRTNGTCADVGQQVGEECTEFFETHTARVAHEVHVHWLDGTNGVKLYVTTMTISNACPIRETVLFSNLVTARTHVVEAFRSGKCLTNQSARARDWEERADVAASFACPEPECSLILAKSVCYEGTYNVSI